MPSCQQLSVRWSVALQRIERHATYKVAVFQRHELFGAHVLVGILVVGRDAFAIYCALQFGQRLGNVRGYGRRTSGEHLAVASANFSIGLVRPGIFVDDGKMKAEAKSESRCVHRLQATMFESRISSENSARSTTARRPNM